MNDQVKIGDMLWGGEYGRPERWRALPVTGETTRSWLLGPPQFKPVKVSKSTMLEAVPNYGSIRWFTEAGKADEEFRRTHAHRIGNEVSVVRDAAILRQIADLIGYKHEKA